ncbi:hypothetical protein [Sphingomonas sp. GB1N7]|uniref:hypothetical protein n=1 Tax=Parasphingomonas caseinilytica TaxID=3096158 RepID=UPI002FC67C58
MATAAITAAPRAGIAQPWLGLIGIVVTLAGSIAVVVSLTPAMMGTWITLCVSCIVPLQFLVAVMWKHEHPGRIARLAQPWRGLAYLGMFVAFAAIVSGIVLALLGGWIMPPTPFPNTYVIYVVQITMCLIVAFQEWPMSLTRFGPVGRGVGTLAISYGVTALLFFTLFNFSDSKAAPFYHAALDPSGMFVSWIPMTFTMTTVGVLLTLLYFDFLPLSLIAARVPALGKQPTFGLVTIVFSMAVGGAIWWVGTVAIGMDRIMFLARIDVAYVFGILMIINIFQLAPFVTLPQPWRGVVLTLATCAIASIVYPMYTWIAQVAFGGLPSGAPGYQLELWMASALLAITFPMIALYSGTFGFWPFAVRTSDAS